MYEFLWLIPPFDWLIESSWNLLVIKYFGNLHVGLAILARKGSKFSDLLVFMEQSTPKKVHLHEIQCAGFAAMQKSRVFFGRPRKAGSWLDLCLKRVNSDKEVKLFKGSWNKSAWRKF